MLFTLLAFLVTAPYRASAAGEREPRELPVSGDQELAIAITIPLAGGQRVIRYGGKDPTFPVTLTNLTDHPLHLWQEWNSWGYHMLSFELTGPDGKVMRVARGLGAWTINGPSWDAIAPHGNLVLDVHFADDSLWSRAHFPRPTKKPLTYTMRAILEVRPTQESREHSVWIGRIVSEPVNCTFSSGI